MSKRTVLEYAAVADTVADTALMDACMSFMFTTEDRYVAEGCITTFAICQVGETCFASAALR